MSAICLATSEGHAATTSWALENKNRLSFYCIGYLTLGFKSQLLHYILYVKGKHTIILSLGTIFIEFCDTVSNFMSAILFL